VAAVPCATKLLVLTVPIGGGACDALPGGVSSGGGVPGVIPELVEVVVDDFPRRLFLPLVLIVLYSIKERGKVEHN
jgi:hypothetical protein